MVLAKKEVNNAARVWFRAKFSRFFRELITSLTPPDSVVHFMQISIIKSWQAQCFVDSKIPRDWTLNSKTTNLTVHYVKLKGEKNKQTNSFAFNTRKADSKSHVIFQLRMRTIALVSKYCLIANLQGERWQGWNLLTVIAFSFNHAVESAILFYVEATQRITRLTCKTGVHCFSHSRRRSFTLMTTDSEETLKASLLTRSM